MTLRRPRRLRSFSYTGKYSYFVTFCTRDRKEIFDSDEHVGCVREQILRTCGERRFAIPAAVFMPDHVHLLVRGLDKDSRFMSCMTLARRRSALTYRRTFEADLWQDGYFERVVRDADDERGAIRYIVNNAVRRGFAGRRRIIDMRGPPRSQRGSLLPRQSPPNHPTGNTHP